jgi:drug/metabolite transporter (DMT)-like permease
MRGAAPAGSVGRVGADPAAAGSKSAVAALATACVLWGAAFPFARIGLRELPVSHLILLRFAAASAILMPVVIQRAAWPRKRNISRYLLVGFLAIPVTYLLQFNGLALTTVSRASLIIGALPPMTAFASARFLNERGGAHHWIGMALSGLGMLMMVGLPRPGGSWAGDVMVFLSTLVSTAWILMSERLSREEGPLAATAGILFFGTITTAPIALIWDGMPNIHISFAAWGAILSLGLLCTVLTFMLWNWGLEKIGAGRGSVFLNLEPLVGAALGVALWGEPLGMGLIIGGPLILGGAAYVSLPDATAARIGRDVYRYVRTCIPDHWSGDERRWADEWASAASENGPSAIISHRPHSIPQNRST